jgi:hypothetical protein
MKTLTIDPQAYSSNDVDVISEIILDLLSEHYGIDFVTSVSFQIEVDYIEESDMS